MATPKGATPPNAFQVEARGIADAGITRAKGDAAAELIRAEGSRKAAELLAGSETAVRAAHVGPTQRAAAHCAACAMRSDAARAGGRGGLVRGGTCGGPASILRAVRVPCWVVLI